MSALFFALDRNFIIAYLMLRLTFILNMATEEGKIACHEAREGGGGGSRTKDSPMANFVIYICVCGWVCVIVKLIFIHCYNM